MAGLKFKYKENAVAHLLMRCNNLWQTVYAFFLYTPDENRWKFKVKKDLNICHCVSN